MIGSDHILSELESRIVTMLELHGPLTGDELLGHLHQVDSLNLWKVCHESNLLRVINSARYYLRYDITRENQLRLSPSILRDFLTFSVVSLYAQKAEAVESSARLANKHRIISRRKMSVARKAIQSLDADVRKSMSENACFFISGDVAYYLGHEVPRLHSELETHVNGSDIDIIAVYNLEVEDSLVKRAEAQLLKYKFRALRSPDIAEEIDFLFKPVTKMLRQLEYQDIHQKIASKILYESFYLYGNLDLYETLLLQLEISGTLKKIEQDFEIALLERKQTIQKIFESLSQEQTLDEEEIQSLFYFSQERLEFQ